MNKAKETDEKEVEMEKGVELVQEHGSDYADWVAKSFLLFCNVCFGR